MYLTVYLEFGILENLLPLKYFGIEIFEDEWNFFFLQQAEVFIWDQSDNN